MTYDEAKAEVFDWLLPPQPGQRFRVVAANYNDHLVVHTASAMGVCCREESSGRTVYWPGDDWWNDRLSGCITHDDLRRNQS